MLIDISRLLARAGQGRLPTGVDRVGLAYLSRWGSRAQAVLQKGTWRRLVPAAESHALFDLVQRPTADFAWRLKKLIARACVPPWPSQDAKGRVAFYLAHSELDRPGFGVWLQRTRQKPVFFVHDLIPITHPEYCRPGETQAHTQRMRLALQLGAGVVANSAATLASLTAFAQAQGLAMPPATVALLAPAQLPAPALSTRPMAPPYFVVLGTIEPRKNHVLLLTLWRELAERLGTAAPHLVVIGQRGWECENAADLLERCEALRGLVHEVPDCKDTELPRYLHHAQALLFPSFAEGYGMPLAEALQAGTPVVASSLPVFEEIAGDVPEYLSPLDGLGWLEAITDYAAPDGPRRQAQLQRMQALALPTWDEHFEQVQRLLEQIEAVES
ncbi:MAG: glycosyltransferase family 1 protein [Pseudomonadota bacterium]